MTPKERMMTALHLGQPDRLPVTVHQWQPYHLKHFMGGVSPLEAFKECGLDASIQYLDALPVDDPNWRVKTETIASTPKGRRYRHTAVTPGGSLSWTTGIDELSTWYLEPMIKRHEDIELIEKYMPVPRIDKADVVRQYDAVGDAGILRGYVWGCQAGCWQHACCLVGEERLIMEAMDEPEWVHRLMRILLEKKLRFIEQSLAGAKFDIVETGGGAGSDTLISPAMHREFCLPYDRQMHAALHAAGQRVTYHTCGGMMYILDLILQNGCDASETLSPPGTGGNIEHPEKVRAVFGGKIAMIGGLDQFNILGTGTAAQIEAEVRRLFEGFGKDGGYICSASDHFYEATKEHMLAYARAGRACVY